MIKKLNTLLLASFFVPSIFAQTPGLINLEFGTFENFDIATWNVEFFPKEDQTTIDYMVELIEELELDVIAIQEIDDAAAFQDLIDLFQGYDGVYQGGDFLKLGYIYNTQSVTVNEVYDIYEAESFDNPFPRKPMVMELTFMDDYDFVVINNHFKCCGNGVLNENNLWDEETRRAFASQLLKQYMDEFHANENVIMLGDLNDLLIDPPSNNVFSVFYEDSENYRFADQEIAIGSSSQWSFPSWPSHLDHILISDELFPALDNESSKVETIQIDEYFPGGFDGYEDNVSDHLPVAFGFNPETIETLSNQKGQFSNESIRIFPNPSNGKTTIRVLRALSNVKLTVLNSYGQIIKEVMVANDQNLIEVDLSNNTPGFYILQLSSGAGLIWKEKVILSQ